MKKFYIYIFYIFISLTSYGQFNKTLGPLMAVAQVYNNSFKIHETDSFYFLIMAEYFNVVVLKTDKNGNLLKKARFPVNSHNGASSVISENRLIIASNIMDTNQNYFGIIYVTNFNLDTVLTKKIDNNYVANPINPNPNKVKLYYITKTPDHGYILGGKCHKVTGITFTPQTFLIKTDRFFNIQWYKDLNLPGATIRKVKLTHDLGIMIITTETTNNLIKTNALGDIQWTKTLQANNPYQFQTSFAYGSNNEYFFATLYKYITINSTDFFGFYLQKINGITGQTIWDSAYTTLINICNNGSAYDILPLKVTTLNNGNIVVSGSGITPIVSSYAINDGYCFNGFSLTLSPNGIILDTNFYFLSPSGNYSMKSTFLNDIIINPNNYDATGFGLYISETHMGCDSITYWLFKTGPGGVLSNNKTKASLSKKLFISPNPAEDYCTLEITGNTSENKELILYTIDGRMILHTSFAGNSFKLNTSNYIRGIYFTTIKTDQGIYYGKFIKK